MYGALQKPNPDIERFIKTIRGEMIPERPPLFEYIIDDCHIRDITIQHLGREWVEPDWSSLKSLIPFLDNFIAVWRALGYDYVRLELTAGFELPVKLAPDPGTQGKTDRSWADAHHGAVENWNDFETYAWPDKPAEFHLEILDYVAKHLPDGMGFITCHAGGIYEIVTRLMSYEGLCLDLYDNPDLVEAVVQRTGECMETYYKAFLEIEELSVVIQGDDMGHRTGLLISQEHLQKYFLPWHTRFAALAHERGLPYCLHSCGDVSKIMPSLIEETGIDGKHSFEDVIMPVTEFYDAHHDKIAVIGGLDLNILAAGSLDEVRTGIRALIDHCAPRGHYLAGSGNSIASYVPLENYIAMIAEAQR